MAIDKLGTSLRLVLIAFTITLCGVSVLPLPNSVQAAVFKCTDASGNVSYSQTSCAREEKAETLLSAKSGRKNTLDCRIANNFAYQVAVRMRSGETSGVVFDSYGGIDAIPNTTVGVISYVYSHKDNLKTGPQRIAALSSARCSANAYGPVGCDDFPFSFIAELGGCERAVMKTTQSQLTTTPTTQNTPPVHEGSTQALGVKTPNKEISNSADCRQDRQDELTALFEQIRSGQSAENQDQLESRKKELREKPGNC